MLPFLLAILVAIVVFVIAYLVLPRFAYFKDKKTKKTLQTRVILVSLAIALPLGLLVGFIVHRASPRSQFGDPSDPGGKGRKFRDRFMRAPVQEDPGLRPLLDAGYTPAQIRAMDQRDVARFHEQAMRQQQAQRRARPRGETIYERPEWW